MKKQILLGATVNQEIAFAEIEVRHWNNKPEFFACFFTVTPHLEAEFDAEEYWQNYIDDCFSKEELYNICERFDCCPSEMAENLASEESTPQECLDCSLYPNEIFTEGNRYENKWYFESGCCGQYDVFSEMDFEALAVENYTLLTIQNLWKNFRLEKLDEEKEEEIQNFIDGLSNDEETQENWIAKYLQETF